MKLVETAPHEFAANYIYHGIGGYFACDRTVKDVGGSTGFIPFEVRRSGTCEQWHARLRYRSSNLLPPEHGYLPSGKEFALESVREFILEVRRDPDEDDAGQQSFSAHIAPRWQGMEGEKRDGSRTTISIPDALEEGMNVRVTGSNIAFGRYHHLIRVALENLGIAGHYVEHPDHELGNVQDAAHYVRLHKDDSGPIHARDGTLARMGHLLESDRSGRRKLVQNDSDENGRTVEGYYHTVTVDQRRIREAWPTHRLTKEIKHYYAREAATQDEDSPLAHPKLEASYQASFMPHDAKKVSTDPDDLAELGDELTEAVHSVLEDSGIDLAPQHGTGAYVPDAYFKATTSEQEAPTTLDLDEIQHEQESLVVSMLARAGGFSPVEEESIKTLLSDGGRVSPQKIADETGRHYDSVTRALRRIDPLLVRSRENVALRSEHVAGVVAQAIDEARDAAQRAMNTIDAADRAVKQGLDDAASSFVAWAEAHGVDYRDRRDVALELRMGKQPSPDVAAQRVRMALRRWVAAGRDEARFRQGVAKYETPKGRRTVDLWRLI
jgi:hypothetical protein